MKLPPSHPDPEWTRIRQHDLQKMKIWDPARAPQVAASYAARLRLLEGIVRRIAPLSAKLLDVGCAQGTLGLQLAESSDGHVRGHWGRYLCTSQWLLARRAPVQLTENGG